jgi:hypothetical protein
MRRIETYLAAAVAVFFIAASMYVMRLRNKMIMYKEAYNTEYSNKRALESEVDSLYNNTELIKYSIKDIKYSNDSLVRELYDANKKLKHKDKNIKQLQYLLSSAERTDSVILRDTILCKDIQIDTTIGDEWIKTRLQIEYPSTIKVTPQVKSEKMVFMNETKKIDGKPSRVFFIRWFQKRYTTVEVDIIENNPYIVNDRSKFIEIIK